MTCFARIRAANGIYSTSDKHARFGRGAETSIACVEIAWPSGMVQRAMNPGINQILHITETAP
ncbi:MAG: ASPIC/UnbV domain-containing protein [Vicinamibacteria bacterium]|nr:ASPIC/UnbV domain-containing protein [Vicinamibacteria bacterium]